MRKGIQTRESILDKAIFFASTEGFEALTIGKLASETSMSKSGLFAHFKSKEKLQLDLLKAAAKKFHSFVIKPSRIATKGEAQIRAIANNLIHWDNADFMPGGCLFMTASIEFDDKPGVVLDFLQRNQEFWSNYLSKVIHDAIHLEQFRDDLDVEQFEFEFRSIFPSYHYACRILQDSNAENRAKKMLNQLIENARA